MGMGRILRTIGGATTWSWRFLNKCARLVRPFQPLFTVVSLLVSVFSVWFTYSKYMESQETAKKAREESIKIATAVVGHLENMNSLFESFQGKIETLPRSVDRFDSAVAGLATGFRRQQQDMAASIGGLGVSIDQFSASLHDYDQNLRQIGAAADKNLNLLKQTQAAWEVEVSRRPDMLIVAEKSLKTKDSTLHIYPILFNQGNQVAEQCRVLLWVPAELKFRSPGWSVFDSTSSIQSWNFIIPGIVPYSSDTSKTTIVRPKGFDFEVAILPGSSDKPLILDCTLYHLKGSQDGKLVARYSSR